MVDHFVHFGDGEYTDNATVQQHITPVNARVGGFIKEIRFNEYQQVHKGDTLVVIEDSELYDMYNLKVYKPLDIAEAVKRCIAVIDECRKTDISIIRLGLQSTSEITAANSHIYGPVSDNLAEYVLAGIVRKSIESKLPKDLKEDIQVYVPKKYISITVGPKKVNKIYFENKYNVKYVVKGES